MRYLIKNALIADGTGDKPFRGYVLTDADRIAAVGSWDAPDDAEVIDAEGLVLCPGFIDLHTHADIEILRGGSDEIKLQQGVTSIIVGNCGFSAVPVSAKFRSEALRYFSTVMDTRKIGECFTHKQYFDELKMRPPGLNAGALVGNGAIRIAVKGFSSEPMTRTELETAKGYLAAAMEEGCFGLSFGLMYAPENFYSKDELVEIVSVLKPYGGILVTHIRGEANSLVSSIDEVIEITRAAGVPLHISHFKSAGKNNWGHALDTAMERIESAVSDGCDITCDVYAYTAGSTMLSTLLPPWALEGGVESLLKRLEDKASRTAIFDEVNSEQTAWDNIVYSTGWDAVTIASARKEENKPAIGRNVAELAALVGKHPIDYAFDLMLSERDNVIIVFHHTNRDDMVKALKWKRSMTASDSLYNEGTPHPRLYGNFPRIFSEHVRNGDLSLEEAVYKCAGYPARRFGLGSLGFIKQDYRADLVLLDMEKIRDKATYLNPRQYPEGIEKVFLGGELAVDNGVVTNKTRGVILTRNTHTPS